MSGRVIRSAVWGCPSMATFLSGSFKVRLLRLTFCGLRSSNFLASTGAFRIRVVQLYGDRASELLHASGARPIPPVQAVPPEVGRCTSVTESVPGNCSRAARLKPAGPLPGEAGKEALSGPRRSSGIDMPYIVDFCSSLPTSYSVSRAARARGLLGCRERHAPPLLRSRRPDPLPFARIRDVMYLGTPEYEIQIT